MNLRIKIPVLLISTFLLFYSCQEEKPQREIKLQSAGKKAEKESRAGIYKVTAAQFKNYKMKLGNVSMSNVNQSISAAGYIEVPKESIAEVRSYIGGYLRSSPLLPGDFVKKGQFLISLENLEYIQLQQDYLQAKEELIYLKAVYERQKVLADEKITSQNNKQLAESEYNSALANYEGLRKKLQLININPDKIQPEDISSSINLYAPINGYITKVDAVKGKFAEPTDVIFEIINTNNLHIELRIYEKDILKIRKGQKISFRIPEADAESYSGEVFLVGKTIEASDRTIIVYCHISENSNIPVVVGMYVEAEIYFERHDAYCLPASAFVREEDEYFIFVNQSVNDEYVFKKIKVNTGKKDEDCIEIDEASQTAIDGKKVLIKGAFNL